MIPTEVRYLNWHEPEELQQKAIEYFTTSGRRYVPFLIQWTGKDAWENVVSVIEKLSPMDRQLCIPGLLQLLQDMNWPGALKAFELLKACGKAAVIAALEESLLKARDIDDTVWVAYLKSLVKQMDIVPEDFKRSGVYEILSIAEW